MYNPSAPPSYGESTNAFGNFCPKCGNKLDMGANFCSQCGHDLRAAENHPVVELGALDANQISTSKIAGFWGCCCIPLGWALFKKEASGPHDLIHSGVVFLFWLIPCGFTEPRTRRSTKGNGFVKSDGSDPDNVDQYWCSWWVCNGASCSYKFC